MGEMVRRSQTFGHIVFRVIVLYYMIHFILCIVITCLFVEARQLFLLAEVV